MNIKSRLIVPALVAIVVVLSGCHKTQVRYSHEIVASSDMQWTGIGVTSDEMIFVNYPRWSDNVPVSVAVIKGGKPVPYPGADFNSPENKPSFNAIQSVVVDAKDRLWVLETGNPQFKGVTGEGPMLHQFNVQDDSLVKSYSFPKGVYKKDSYFNDVRVDTKTEMAYMTDSGNGAIIILNLTTGVSRRMLDSHPSTESETDHLVCDGHKWINTVHADGIALSPDRRFIYYIALTGHTLYRVPTATLNDFKQTGDKVGKMVEAVATVPATDGMIFDKEGNLWMGGLENNAVNMLTPRGEIIEIIRNDDIRWADSFALGKDGTIYLTTSQIHLPPEQRKTYDIIRLSPR